MRVGRTGIGIGAALLIVATVSGAASAQDAGDLPAGTTFDPGLTAPAGATITVTLPDDACPGGTPAGRFGVQAFGQGYDPLDFTQNGNVFVITMPSTKLAGAQTVPVEPGDEVSFDFFCMPDQLELGFPTFVIGASTGTTTTTTTTSTSTTSTSTTSTTTTTVASSTTAAESTTTTAEATTTTAGPTSTAGSTTTTVAPSTTGSGATTTMSAGSTTIAAGGGGGTTTAAPTTTPGLPSTGGNGTATAASLAFVALIVGVGAVAATRRRYES